MSRLPIYLLLLIGCAVFAQGSDVARMDQIVQSYVMAGKFMGSVLVARDDQIVFSKGYGSANLEWNIPNDATTKFRIGSLTKQFTAAAILVLEEQGKLKVTDRLKTYLPDAPAAWDQITLYHLLTHTSGIPNFTDFPGYAKSEFFAVKPDQLIGRFRDKPLDFQPGTKWKYSNSGYVVLGRVIEKVSGQSYADFVHQHLLAPAGMRDSGYDSNLAVIIHRASGYSPSPTGPKNAGYIDMSVPFSAGALYSTTEDLWRWEKALFGGRLISAASLERMTTPFLSDYAFGLFVQTNRGVKIVTHSGGIEGFNTYLAYYPTEHLTVAVLGNLNQVTPDAIGRMLGQVALGRTVKLISERKAIDLPEPALRRFLGTYADQTGRKYFVTLDGKQLMAQMDGQAMLPLYAESANQFFLKAVDAEIEFTPGDQSQITGLIIHQNGQNLPMVRTSTETPPAPQVMDVPLATLQSYVGVYQLSPNFEIAVTLEGNQLWAQATAQPKFRIFPESKTKFFLKVVKAEIEFIVPADGQNPTLILHQGGRDLVGTRQ